MSCVEEHMEGLPYQPTPWHLDDLSPAVEGAALGDIVASLDFPVSACENRRGTLSPGGAEAKQART